jgi:hypothetical protein
MDSRLRLSSKSLIGEASGMTVGGELQLLALGQTWNCIYYITELTFSELGKIQTGFPITDFGNDRRGVDSQ